MPFASGDLNFKITANSGTLTKQSDGGYLAIWASGGRIWAQGFTADGSHDGGQFQIASGAAAYADVSATLLSNGDTIVTWIEGGSVKALRLGTSHEVIGTVQDLGLTQVWDQHSPVAYAIGNGNYTVQYKGSGGILAQTTVEGEMISKSSFASAYDYRHAFTVLSNGNFVTLYNGDFRLQFEDSTNAHETKYISRDPNAPVNQTATALSDGTFVAAWQDSATAGGASVIKAQVFDNDRTAVGTPVTFLTPPGTVEAIEVSQLSTHGYALLLTMNNGADRDVYVATCTQTGTILTPPSLVGQSAAGDQVDPHVVPLADGTIAVSWFNAADSTLMTEVFALTGAVNTAPTNIHLASGGTVVTIAENAPGGHGVAVVAADDDDGAAGLRYFMTDNTFAIDAESGQIRVKDGAVLDYEGTNAFTVAVTVKDQNGAGQSSSQDITIKLTDIVETIQGTKGKNVVTGGIGADKLNGGSGNDVLTGKAGSDIFVFNTALGKGTMPSNQNKKVNFDTITDFDAKDDSIWLDNKIFTKLGKSGSETSPVHLNKSFFKLGKATDKNDYIVYKKGIVYYDADGIGTKYKPVEIIKLANGAKITVDDFFVI